ncbi:hypothetical protein MLD38_008249 [Melastoma candidum]|uniref:Uncharacterized protein n=1 Tax=Melastoma candidum TaxID=119954 RepID=A0ACB9RXF8_9MYRT|nr:hypothetical protein MLD38_008249 [Melastoma candidum]
MAEEECKRVVLVKFKEGVDAEKLLLELMEKFCEIDVIQSLEWGQDVGGPETLRRGFTHAFIMTFKNKEDIKEFISHPIHRERIPLLAEVTDEKIIIDFLPVIVKALSR